MTNRLFPAGLLALLSMLTAPIAVTGEEENACQEAQKRPEAPRIPDELRFAQVFVQVLQEAGISVKSVHLSTNQAWFSKTKQAAAVETNKGWVSVVVFHEREDAAQVRVEELSGEPDDRHRYRITETQGGPSKTISSARPVYFITENEMFVTTQSKELAKAVEGALKRR